MNRVHTIVAAVGLGVGWVSIETVTGLAQIFAYVGTGAWGIGQLWFLVFRQRCTRRDCARRITK